MLTQNQLWRWRKAGFEQVFGSRKIQPVSQPPEHPFPADRWGRKIADFAMIGICTAYAKYATKSLGCKKKTEVYGLLLGMSDWPN